MTGAARGVRWSPVRHAWRSTWGHRRGQALAMVAMSALVTACTVFAPVYDRAMQQALVDTLLAGASPVERTVTVVSEAKDFTRTDALDPRELAGLLPDDVAAQLAPTVLGRSASVTPVTGEVPPSGLLLWRDGACEHLRLSEGTCPVDAGEILVSDADADTFGLGVGSRVDVSPAEREEDDVRLEVVGTYASADGAWWQGQRTTGFSRVFRGVDPSANHDAWLTTEETFLVAAILTGETSQAGAPVPTAGAEVDEVLALGERVEETARELDERVREDAQLRTGLDLLTDDVRAQVRQAHRTVPLLVAPMAVLSVFVLWLVLGAATAQRRGDVAIARLRGRGPAGAAGLLLLELLPALLVGVVPGAAAALLGGVVVSRLLPGEAPLEIAPGFVVAVLLALAALVLTAVVAAVRTAREPLHDVVRSGVVASRRWALGAVDAFLLAAVGTGVLAFASGSLRGPLALAGPALLALFAGLVLGHLAVPAAGAAGRALLRRGRLVAGVSLLEAGRRRETRAVVAVITVAVALGVFALDALAIGERNRDNAAQHEAGAPVVLQVVGADLDGVRRSLAAADPDGRSTTPVLVARETLAVEPATFDDIAFFPRGAPTGGQWRSIAPPDVEPVVLTGARVSLDVRPDAELSARDIFGSDIQVDLGLVVSSATGTRSAVPLGALPPSGEGRRLAGRLPGCADGCWLVAVQLRTAQRVQVTGALELTALRVDGEPVQWGTAAADWNVTEGEETLIVPRGSSPDGVLRLELDTGGEYPVEVTPAWVPRELRALVTDPSDDSGTLTGVDGGDRSAESVGKLVLAPSMPRRAAVVDLDAATRGVDITPDSRLEVWLDDARLVDAVTASLDEQGVAVADVRRVATIRRTYEDTVASWSLALGAAIAPAVMLLALLVLAVLAVIGWGTRARDLAVLRLHGVGAPRVRRLAVASQLPAVLVAVLGGVVAGLTGAVLAMPDVAFFPVAPDVPVVDTATSWPTVVTVGAVSLVVLPVVAGAAGALVARRAHLGRVREGSR